jgi:hypothetical protein
MRGWGNREFVLGEERPGSGEEHLLGFRVLRVYLDTLHRTLHPTHGAFVEPHTFRAHLCDDNPFVQRGVFVNSPRGTGLFARAAVDALICNFQAHEWDYRHLQGARQLIAHQWRNSK